MLLVDNEKRGNDASGLCIQQADGSLNILKKDVPGWKLFASPEYEEFIKAHLHPNSRCVLVHARGASSGNPRDNNNNHPIYAGVSAVIHNGALKNSDELFNQFKLERKAEPDTDIARAVFDRWGFTKEAIEKLAKSTGSGTIAAVHPKYPNYLMLIRSGNPLTLASNEDFFFFSSEKATLHKVCRPYVQRMGMWFQAQRPDVDFTNMVDNTAWLIGPRGLEAHFPCRICTGNYIEPWRKTYEEYAQRQEKWTKLKEGHGNVHVIGKGTTAAWCHTCQREWNIPSFAVYSQYTCDVAKGGCGKTLWAIPVNKPSISTVQ